jgi:hypothetical protein
LRRLVLVLLLALSACRQRPQPSALVEEPLEAAIAIRMADPQAQGQLLSGFHEIEQGAWRWTEREFAVTLRAPFLASQRGAVLKMAFAVPAPIVKLGPLTLKATVNGVDLPPERYTSDDKYEFVREVPPSAFGEDNAKIVFSTDRFLVPGGNDKRELSVIVESIALEPVKD